MRVVSLHADYQAKATDSEVLRRPLKSELQSHEIRNVFGFPRNLRDRYLVAEVLGAGSFGVVRTVSEGMNLMGTHRDTYGDTPNR